ncbi:MAG: ROK family protein [Candidatus Dormibacteria bacterium]
MPAASGRRLVTLSLDVGGTGIKGDTLDASGKPTANRVRLPTVYPLAPNDLLGVFATISESLPSFDRVSIGFPGVVRGGLILSAPHFVLEGGDGTAEVPELVRAWERFNLATATAKALGKPTRVGNDADVQGLAVMKGKGLEVVLTLGTGVGSAVFEDGRLGPHLELAHHPLRKQKTYNEYLGDSVRKHIGDERWNRRVGRMVEVVRRLLFFDHLYIGGGNSARVTLDLGNDVSLVDNEAGILGGIRLWEQPSLPTHNA